jgi:hypothetical protein
MGSTRKQGSDKEIYSTENHRELPFLSEEIWAVRKTVSRQTYPGANKSE